MAHTIHTHVDRIDALQEPVEDSAETLLEGVDIQDVLNDPQTTLRAVAETFLQQHLDQIEQAAEEGERFGRAILKKTAD